MNDKIELSRICDPDQKFIKLNMHFDKNDKEIFDKLGKSLRESDEFLLNSILEYIQIFKKQNPKSSPEENMFRAADTLTPFYANKRYLELNEFLAVSNMIIEICRKLVVNGLKKENEYYKIFQSKE